jgi:gamma-glutamyl-gamma-aminobutyraldehyde dehydrogenase
MSVHALTFDDWTQARAALHPEGRAFIDGDYVAARSGETFPRVSPIDGSHLADIARCGAADIDAAVAAARRSFESGVWRSCCASPP